MHKIIHSKFQLDLTPYGVSTVEDNHWFSDGFFTKYSFPFTLKLDDDLILVFGDLLDDNNILNETYFEVDYVIGNKLEKAVFEINSQIGLEVEVTFRWGIEEFPNWEKKLSELTLDHFEVVDIEAHAETIISQSWPQVNYNFPQVYTEYYTGADWEYFEKVINKHNGTSFINNIVEQENGNDIIKNKNFIQPLPYLLHIIEKGINDAGFNLKGDVLTNNLLKKVLLYSPENYYNRNVVSYQGNIIGDDLNYNASTNTWGSGIIDLFENETIENGAYRIKGKYYVKIVETRGAQFRIRYNGIEDKWSHNFDFDSNDDYIYETGQTYEFEIDEVITITSAVYFFAEATYTGGYLDVIADVVLEKETGNTPVEIDFKNEINLKETSPDISFGELMTELKKLFFIDISIDNDNKDMYINIVENQINSSYVVDLSNKEVVPKKYYPSEKQFCLKYKEISDDISFYKPIYITKNGVSYDENKEIEIDKTTEVNIIPLPVVGEDLSSVAAAIENNKSSLYVVLYNGLSEGRNNALDPSEMSPFNIYHQFYKSYFFLKFFGITYEWSFVDWIENISEISKKIFAYGKYHIVKSLTKTQISKDLYEVEIETESLE